MKISVIVVNFNGKNYIADCLDSVLKTDFNDFEIVVVENGSNDGSWQLLNKKYKKIRLVKLIKSSENLFFTGGGNLGAKKAKGEWLVFLNADTVADKNWLKEMVKLVKHKRLIQPKIKIYQTNKIDCVWGDYLWPGWGRAHGRGETDKGQYEVNRQADYANGTCLMIEKKFFLELGGFDENFKFFYEDVDLNLRARKQGGQAWYGAKAMIWHKGSLSFKQNVASETVQYYYHRNRKLTVMKNFKGIDRRIRLAVLGLV
ncbi:MAG: glycosyltransferase family 2 protein [Candidatus Beckwithbacteria bacterium]|nr:glycosyltransferase family 2 protein [Candidatus Beckwithbacteria bacterium]